MSDATKTEFCVEDSPSAEQWAGYADGLKPWLAPVEWRLPVVDETLIADRSLTVGEVAERAGTYARLVYRYANNLGVSSSKTNGSMFSTYPGYMPAIIDDILHYKIVQARLPWLVKPSVIARRLSSGLRWTEDTMQRIPGGNEELRDRGLFPKGHLTKARYVHLSIPPPPTTMSRRDVADKLGCDSRRILRALAILDPTPRVVYDAVGREVHSYFDFSTLSSVEAFISGEQSTKIDDRDKITAIFTLGSLNARLRALKGLKSAEIQLFNKGLEIDISKNDPGGTNEQSLQQQIAFARGVLYGLGELDYVSLQA